MIDPLQNEDAPLGPGLPRRLPGLTVGAIIEVAIRIIRRHYPVLLLIAVVFQAPAALLTSAAGIGLSDTFLDVFPDLAAGRPPSVISISDDELRRLAGSLGLVLLASALAGVLGAIATLGCAAVVAADHDGRPIGFRDASVTALRRTLVGLAVVVLTTLIVVGLSLLAASAIVGSLAALPPDPRGGGGPGVFAALVVAVALVFTLIYLSLRWAVALPCAALEKGGPLRVLARSWHLSGGNMWRTFAILVAGVLATSVLSAVLAQLLSIVVVDILAQGLGVVLMAELLVGVAATVIVAPIVPVLVTVLYHDLRARRHGWELPAAASSEPPDATPPHP